jgi:hypothetical protein
MKGRSRNFELKSAATEENCELGYDKIFGTNAKIVLVLQQCPKKYFVN